MKDKPTKIFITHSTEDKGYVILLTKLLRSIKVPNDCIVCTSDHRHTIPNGENAYKWLKKQFGESNLHMIFVLSKNYYRSNPCLNEMGAAWLASTRSDLLLLPGFSFCDLKKESGCLDNDLQGCSFESDDTMIKRWLNNLRDDVLLEFRLEKPDEIDWEESRDSFIKDIQNLTRATNSDECNISQDDYEKGSVCSVGHSNNPVVKAIANVGGKVQGYDRIAILMGVSVASVKRKMLQAINEGEVIVEGDGKKKVFRLNKKMKDK